MKSMMLSCEIQALKWLELRIYSELLSYVENYRNDFDRNEQFSSWIQLGIQPTSDAELLYTYHKLAPLSRYIFLSIIVNKSCVNILNWLCGWLFTGFVVTSVIEQIKEILSRHVNELDIILHNTWMGKPYKTFTIQAL